MSRAMGRFLLGQSYAAKVGPRDEPPHIQRLAGQTSERLTETVRDGDEGGVGGGPEEGGSQRAHRC